MTRDNRATICIIGLFILSVSAWAAYLAHIGWMNSHYLAAWTTYGAVLTGYMYIGLKWIKNGRS